MSVFVEFIFFFIAYELFSIWFNLKKLYDSKKKKKKLNLYVSIQDDVLKKIVITYFVSETEIIITSIYFFI